MSKYVCVFCDERRDTSEAECVHGRVGICRNCAEKLPRTALSLPYKGTENISYIMSPFEYTGIMKRPILDFKFNGCRAYAPLFADMMKEYLNSYNIWSDFDSIVPVPLHANRLRERGYNQSELIALHISEYLHIPLDTRCVSRMRATEKQSTLKRADRVSNVKNAFRCDTDLSGRKIILFDDIYTTGNTLDACACTLKNSGAEFVCGLTFAIHFEQKLPILTY